MASSGKTACPSCGKALWAVIDFHNEQEVGLACAPGDNDGCGLVMIHPLPSGWYLRSITDAQASIAAGDHHLAMSIIARIREQIEIHSNTPLTTKPEYSLQEIAREVDLIEAQVVISDVFPTFSANNFPLQREKMAAILAKRVGSDVFPTKNIFKKVAKSA